MRRKWVGSPAEVSVEGEQCILVYCLLRREWGVRKPVELGVSMVL